MNVSEIYKSYMLNRLETILRGYRFKHKGKKFPIIISIEKRLILGMDDKSVIRSILNLTKEFGIKGNQIFIHLPKSLKSNASIFINVKDRNINAVKYIIKESDLDYGYNIKENFERR